MQGFIQHNKQSKDNGSSVNVPPKSPAVVRRTPENRISAINSSYNFTRMPLTNNSQYRRDEHIADTVAEKIPDINSRLPTIESAHADPKQSPRTPASVRSAVSSSGKDLDPQTRRYMEQRLGHDFSKVKIHTDQKAAESATSIQAQAYTYGNHISFAPGNYKPESREGQQLLAHELTHVVQQSNSEPVLQKKDEPGPGKAGGVAANEIFPYPAGSRIMLMNLLDKDNVLPFLAKFAEAYKSLVLALSDPDVAQSLVATVLHSDENKFEAVMQIPSLAATDKRKAIPGLEAALRLIRRPDGKFEVTIMRKEPFWSDTREFSAVKSADGTISITDLNIRDNNISLSITPANAKGERTIQATELPDVAEMIVGMTPVDVISISPLKAPAGSAEEQKQLRARAYEAISRRPSDSRHQLSLSGGFQHGNRWAPMLQLGWSFKLKAYGKGIQLPLIIHMEYIPKEHAMLGASAGLSLGIPTKVPVFLNLAGGLKGGIAHGTDQARPSLPVLGPSASAGAGIGLGKTVKVFVNAEYLFNLFSKSPNLTSFSLGAGFNF